MKKITEETTIEEILTINPYTVSIFLKYGIPAISCGEPIWGTIRENALKYKVQNIEELIEELNKAVLRKKLDISFKNFGF